MKESNENKIFRVLYVVLFYLIYSITDIVYLVITILQTALTLFTDEPSRTLRQFGGSLSVYVKQIGQYLSYQTEQKPYPFSDWPEPEELEGVPQPSVED